MSARQEASHQARYGRLYADERGESHFADIDVDLELADFTPPAPPLHVAALFPALRCGLMCVPVYWDGTNPHPSPHRQLMCTLRGSYEVTANDGSVRCFPAGSVLLLEETTGSGHTTRIVGTEELLVMSVTLGDEEPD